MRIHNMIFAVLFIFTMPVNLLAKETKDIQFKLKNTDQVVFSHTMHLNKTNNDCKACHNAIFDLKNRRHFTMAEMEKAKSCGACHTGVKAFSVADEKKCVRCHKGKTLNIVYKVKGATDAVFSHTSHTGVYSCNDCHNKLLQFEAGTKHYAIGEKPCCGTCHNGKVAFSEASCEKCHPGYKERSTTN